MVKQSKKKTQRKNQKPKKKLSKDKKNRVFAKRRLSFCGPSHPAEALHEKTEMRADAFFKGVKRCVIKCCVLCVMCVPLPPPLPPRRPPPPSPAGAGSGERRRERGVRGEGTTKGMIDDRFARPTPSSPSLRFSLPLQRPDAPYPENEHPLANEDDPPAHENW